ncbi:MAG: hypothetical protein RSC49_05940 [Clostridium sp.]
MIRKLTLIILSIGLICLTLISCAKDENKVTKEEIDVKIISSSVKGSYKGMPIELTPKLSGEYTGELKYKWTLEGDNKIIGFYTNNKECQSEIINNGEKVLVALYGEAMPANDSLNGFKVTLQVEDKNISKVLAKDSIDVKNILGDYVVTRVPHKDVEFAIINVQENFKFPNATLDKAWYNEKVADEYFNNSRKDLVDKYKRENLIVILSDFHTGNLDNNPVLEPNTT